MRTSEPKPTSALARHTCSIVLSIVSQLSGITPVVRTAIITRNPITKSGTTLTCFVAVFLALATRPLDDRRTQMLTQATSGASNTTRESLTTVAA